MAQLRRDYGKFTERDTEVIAVGPEDAAAFTRWWRGHRMPFPGIPDPEHAIARDLYGQKFKLFRGGRMPAMAVVDKDGKMRFMHFAGLPSDIPPNGEILSLLESLNKETGKG